MEELEGDINSFRQDVSRFSIIDKRIKEAETQIKPLRETILELKKEKVELKKDICIYMDTNDIEKCNLPENEGSIVFKKRRSVVPINQQIIRDELKRFFCTGPGVGPRFNSLTDIEKATEIYDFIYNNREYKTTDVLTKVK
jgi:uncharacterized protein YdcH (DUF465 family)